MDFLRENCKNRGKRRKTGVTGSERNGSERNCTNMKRALERNQNAGKCKGRTRKEPEDGDENKLLEMTRNSREMKGCAGN